MSGALSFLNNHHLISTGVRVSAENQLSIREISSTWKRDLQYSPVESCDSPIGANARIAITVAPRTGRLR